MWSERLVLERRASRQDTKATVLVPKRQYRCMPPTNPTTRGTSVAHHEMALEGHGSSATNVRSIRRSRQNERLARDAQCRA
jgi:hypothetical protein